MDGPFIKFNGLVGLSLAEEIWLLPYFGSDGGIERLLVRHRHMNERLTPGLSNLHPNWPELLLKAAPGAEARGRPHDQQDSSSESPDGLRSLH